MLANRTLQAAGSGILYQILKSLRFRSSVAGYLSKTFSSVGTRTTWTFSAWVKVSSFSTQRRIFTDTSGNSYIRFNAANQLDFNFWNGTTSYTSSSSAVFRDPSAWYHITVAVDTTQATSTNRVKIYLNGTQVTNWASGPTYPSQNDVSQINNNAAHYIGNGVGELFDGYMSEVNFIDGQALDVSNFGKIDPVSGVWGAKKYTGTYGTNGFYLDFGDTTSLTSLGYDRRTFSRTFLPSATYATTSTTYNFTVPVYSSNIVVTMWGGGGGGGGGGSTFGTNGGAGTASTFSTLSAGGGGGGTGAWTANPTGSSGAGGTATGGDTNTNGNAGATSNGATYGAGAPNGGGTVGAFSNAEHYNGTAPGGGATGGRWAGSGNPTGGGAGSGAYVQKTYAVGALTPGTVITVTVGGGGAAGTSDADNGGTGAAGRVNVVVDGAANANDWTMTNISLTSGPTYDSMTDVPFAAGGSDLTSDFPTLNPLDKHAYVTLSNNNLTVTGNTSTDSGPVTATVGANTGKYYWETTINSAGSGLNYAGIGIDNAKNATNGETYSIASGATAGAGIRSAAGGFNVAYGGYGSYSGATLPGFTTGDIIGVALDLDNGALYFHKNGTWMNSSVPTSGATKTGCFIYWTAGAIYARPATGGYNGSIATLNFGQTAFAYTPPTGFGVLKAPISARGNYATLNPLQRVLTGTLTGANLDSAAGSGNIFRVSTQELQTNSYYECINTANTRVGLVWSQVQDDGSNWFGASTSYFLFNIGGALTTQNCSVSQSLTPSWSTGDTLRLAWDATARTLTLYVNGKTATVATVTSPTGAPLALFANVSSGVATNFSVNFGQRPFIYYPPLGYAGVHTGNLTVPVIRKPNQNFDITTYTGNGTSQSISNSGLMQPDFVWIKNRTNGTYFHQLQDSVRGPTKQLFTNDIQAENTDATKLTSFNTGGFSVGAAGAVNGSGDSLVAWQWKKGTTPGFDIVTYTGTGANTTVSHAVGAIPKLMIVKARTTVGGTHWYVYHASLPSPAISYVRLNTTNAYFNDASVWNSASPTSSVFSLGTNTEVNASGALYVNYLFAEVAGFSKIGAYTGNGSTDGPFVYCGFRPKFLLLRRTDVGSNWYIHDSVRDTYNYTIKVLFPDLTAAESTAELESTYGIDFVANGFKIRASHSTRNTSGGTYIFMAFAETPFKSTLAR